MPFTFTPEQLENLKNWCQYLVTDESKHWQADVNQAVTDYNRILQETGFATGTELTGDQLDLSWKKNKKTKR